MSSLFLSDPVLASRRDGISEVGGRSSSILTLLSLLRRAMHKLEYNLSGPLGRTKIPEIYQLLDPCLEGREDNDNNANRIDCVFQAVCIASILHFLTHMHRL